MILKNNNKKKKNRSNQKNYLQNEEHCTLQETETWWLVNFLFSTSSFIQISPFCTTLSAFWRNTLIFKEVGIDVQYYINNFHIIITKTFKVKTDNRITQTFSLVQSLITTTTNFEHSIPLSLSKVFFSCSCLAIRNKPPISSSLSESDAASSFIWFLSIKQIIQI